MGSKLLTSSQIRPSTTLTAFNMIQLLLLPLVLASPTTNPDNDCGYPFDCVEHGDGWHPDPYNCRKFWHCYGGVGQHYACRTDMLFDLRYNGCNYADQTYCGDRPICGACDEDCVYQTTTTTTATTTPCGHEESQCDIFGAGTHPDPFNCRKYWNCDGAGNGYHEFCPKGQLFTTRYGGACDYDYNVHCGDRPVCDDCDENCEYHPQGVYE